MKTNKIFYIHIRSFRVNCLLKNSDSTGDICCPKLRVLQRVSIYFIKKFNHSFSNK